MYFQSPLDFRNPLIQAQQQLGWNNFFEGVWHHCWRQLQQEHFDFCQLQFSTKKWAHRVLARLWEFHFNLWHERNEIEYQNDKGILLRSLDEDIDTAATKFTSGSYPPGPYFTTVQIQKVKASATIEHKRAWIRNVTAFFKAHHTGPAEPAVLRDKTQQRLARYWS